MLKLFFESVDVIIGISVKLLQLHLLY